MSGVRALRITTQISDGLSKSRSGIRRAVLWQRVTTFVAGACAVAALIHASQGFWLPAALFVGMTVVWFLMRRLWQGSEAEWRQILVDYERMDVEWRAVQ